MSKQCQKCGYIRQSMDTSPDYECPKCGVVYEKYEAYLNSRRKSEKEKVEMEKSNGKRFSAIQVKNWLTNTNGLISKSSTSFRVAYAALTILAVFCAIYFGNYFLTPEDQRLLKSRYSIYIKAMSSLDLDTSYNYLSLDSRSKINQHEWEIGNKSTNPSVTEKIQAIKLSPNGMSAVITTTAIIDNKPINIYRQTWVKEDGTWFRDWARDYPDRVIQARSEAAKLNNENSKPKIYRIETGFDVTKGDFGKILITPKTTLVIYNSSDFPITYLKIKIDYYDKDKNEVLYSTERSVVSDGDTPIPSNGKSDAIYANAGAGFSINMTDIDTSAAKRIKDRVDRAFFYKLSYQGQWTRLSTDDLQ